MLVPQRRWLPCQSAPLHNCSEVSLQTSRLYFCINFTPKSNTANLHIHSPSMCINSHEIQLSDNRPPYLAKTITLIPSALTVLLSCLFLAFAIHCPTVPAGLTCSILSLVLSHFWLGSHQSSSKAFLWAIFPENIFSWLIFEPWFGFFPAVTYISTNPVAVATAVAIPKLSVSDIPAKILRYLFFKSQLLSDLLCVFSYSFPSHIICLRLFQTLEKSSPLTKNKIRRHSS